MRAARKPFAVEYKSRKPPQAAALFDEGMISDDGLPSRDIRADLDDDDRDQRYEEALRAADSVFATKPSETAAPAQEKRPVLDDLSYQDPLKARLEAAAQQKRGRKPGSKNKPRPVPSEAIDVDVDDDGIASGVDLLHAASTGGIMTPRSSVVRRRGVGFLAALKAKRSMKPGDKWKVKARR